ncbi:MAG: hypothetical protein MO846_04375 [Candidatus Devosia symbiotica]|nr:hypothetical protein [Candidatus Devosia symbiotica]
MAGETDLSRLLVGLDPMLDPRPFGLAALPHGQALPLGLVPFGLITEAEGLIVIAELDALAAAGIAAEERWAHITMMVHSALDAVEHDRRHSDRADRRWHQRQCGGGLYHDHLFAPWDRRDEAAGVLRALARFSPASV